MGCNQSQHFEPNNLIRGQNEFTLELLLELGFSYEDVDILYTGTSYVWYGYPNERKSHDLTLHVFCSSFFSDQHSTISTETIMVKYVQMKLPTTLRS